MVTAEHREMLRRANVVSARVRRERGATREWIREPADTWDSRDRLAGLLSGPPLDHLATVQVVDVLSWCRGVGHEKATRILRREGIREGRLVGALTPRQALALASSLRQGTHELVLGASS